MYKMTIAYGLHGCLTIWTRGERAGGNFYFRPCPPVPVGEKTGSGTNLTGNVRGGHVFLISGIERAGSGIFEQGTGGLGHSSIGLSYEMFNNLKKLS